MCWNGGKKGEHLRPNEEWDWADIPSSAYSVNSITQFWCLCAGGKKKKAIGVRFHFAAGPDCTAQVTGSETAFPSPSRLMKPLIGFTDQKNHRPRNSSQVLLTCHLYVNFTYNGCRVRNFIAEKIKPNPRGWDVGNELWVERKRPSLAFLTALGMWCQCVLYQWRLQWL